jgi:hypothetical protein
MKSRLIKHLATAIGTGILIMIIIPILLYEDISDRRWKKENANGPK